MMKPHKTPLTVTVITLNEEQNLRRCLYSIKGWADEILVVDSGSRDRTVEIATEIGAKVVHHAWPGYGAQKNFAQNSATHDWVLNIDADEVLSAPLRREIDRELDALSGGENSVFSVARKTFYLGRWIKHGGWYPNYVARLGNRKFSRWSEPAVHEVLQSDGKIKYLKEPMEHYTFSGIEDQVRTNLRFSRLGFEELKKRGQKACLLKLVLKPWGKFFETYFLKKGFLDGIPGLIISFNAAHSIFLKFAYLYEEKLHARSIDR